MIASLFLGSVLAVLIYSGPLVPMLSTLLYRRASPPRFRRNCRLLLVFTGMQVLAFVPYWIALTRVKSDDDGGALPLLLLPFFVGIPMFAGAAIYAVREYVRFRSSTYADLP